MRLFRSFAVLMLGISLIGCESRASTPDLPTATARVAQVLPTAVPSGIITSSPLVAATAGGSALPTLSAPVLPGATTAATEQPTFGETVLKLAAGNQPGQVGITAEAQPPSFRVAADGSLRVMDTVNKRLLFWNGTTGSLEQTLDLGFLLQPIDFVVTGKGDLYVLDAAAWTLEHLSIKGKSLSSLALNPELKNAFRTISLTADGRIMGLAGQFSYPLVNPDGVLAFDLQTNKLTGSYTVRSNASFAIEPLDGQQRLLIIAPQETPLFALGQPTGVPAFIDVNQGMEPYVAIQQPDSVEVRRFAVNGELLGAVKIDQRGCRPAARAVYVDRPGAVFSMCNTDAGLTIQRFVISDVSGLPLPLVDTLNDHEPWSPSALQAAPG